MNTSYSLSAIIELLNPDNTISAHRYIAHAIGMTETIIYSAMIAKQTYYLKNSMLCEDGWFYSTVNDLQESTTFGIKAQRTAIAHLVEHGLIECEMKGIPAKRYFRISENADKISELIERGKVIAENLRSKAVVNNSETTEPSTNAELSSCQEALSSECPAHYKTKDNKNQRNIDVIDRSSIDSAKSQNFENVESVENSKSMNFADVLEAIGIDCTRMTADIPTSEKQFEFWSEEERKTQNCKIPSYLKNDKTAFKNALKYLCGFSYYFSEHQGTKSEKFFEMLIDTIADMSDEHNDLTERLNDIISRNYLGECFIAFEQRWTKISAEKEIAHPKAYLRSCLWNWLCDYDLELLNE